MFIEVSTFGLFFKEIKMFFDFLKALFLKFLQLFKSLVQKNLTRWNMNKYQKWILNEIWTNADVDPFASSELVFKTVKITFTQIYLNNKAYYFLFSFWEFLRKYNFLSFIILYIVQMALTNFPRYFCFLFFLTEFVFILFYTDFWIT